MEGWDEQYPCFLIQFHVMVHAAIILNSDLVWKSSILQIAWKQGCGMNADSINVKRQAEIYNKTSLRRTLILPKYQDLLHLTSRAPPSFLCCLLACAAPQAFEADVTKSILKIEMSFSKYILAVVGKLEPGEEVSFPLWTRGRHLYYLIFKRAS